MSESKLEEALGVERSVGFDQVGITVASSEEIRRWSNGREVKNPETINYRTFKPEKGGLFCERIFGPTKDWECACGKYKRIKYKGITCDRCGVEVTLSRVRRERMGHIELAVPVTHIWFYKSMPSRIGLMLDMTARQLERVIYYEDYVVTDPGDTIFEAGMVLSENEYYSALEQHGEKFEACMGAEAVLKLLERIDLDVMATDLKDKMGSTKSKQLRRKYAKKLKLVEGFKNSKTRPEWMILTCLPVIPPDLRPLVPLEGGRFATSDLNDLYRRVINRNNRLRTLLALKTPEVIIRNEKRMLQEAVDALFDNGRHGRPVTGTANRPLKSLSDMLKGKSGRFRQNLLGKRVDYSGRSVIVIGPELKLNQCGLPKKMALVLFEPFIIRRLKDLGYVHTVRSAKKMIERQTTEVWDVLDEVTKGHPVMLNRAPSLHRLSIQAFEPILIEGESIRVHPLVCTAFNADFDGDQMAVHVPLSVEAQLEARLLLLAPNNIFSPANGKPITTPSQDIPLGCYYLTVSPREVESKKPKHLPLFSDMAEVELALTEGAITKHSRIRLKNPDYGKKTLFGDAVAKVIETTPGRVIFNEIWPDEIGFYNKVAGKKHLSDIIWRCYKTVGHARTVQALDKLKEVGFREATRAGISIGVSDMIIPKEKEELIRDAKSQVNKLEQQKNAGVITDGERKSRGMDIWTHTGEKIADALFKALENNDGRVDMNSLFIMVDSGARGNRTQIKQLGGMRGLMSKPSGEIIELPIISNFREGLSALEYFISAHGARKGLADTALKTADSGYLTRKLVDAAQDVIVTEQDCGTVNGIVVNPLYDGEKEVVSLAARIVGRTSCEAIWHPITGAVLLEANQPIDEDVATNIENAGIKGVKIRSALTCESKRGICIKCYGRNLATGLTVKLGEAVGIIAAQSIGEPGTQLTMRTFHVGGTASQTFQQPYLKATMDGEVTFEDLQAMKITANKWVVLNKGTKLTIRSKGPNSKKEEHVIDFNGSFIHVKHLKDVKNLDSVEDISQHTLLVKSGEVMVDWDPQNLPIFSQYDGKGELNNMRLDDTIAKEQVNDEETVYKVIEKNYDDKLKPSITIRDGQGRPIAMHSFEGGSYINPEIGKFIPELNSDKRVAVTVDIAKSQELGKTPRTEKKTKDITGGLPRIAQLFEARTPTDDIAVMAKGSGEVMIKLNLHRAIVKRKKDKIEEEIHSVIAEELDENVKVKDKEWFFLYDAATKERVSYEVKKRDKTKTYIRFTDPVTGLLEENAWVQLATSQLGKVELTVVGEENGVPKEYKHVFSSKKKLMVSNGSMVKTGDRLTYGTPDIHDILDLLGPQPLQEHLLNEVQEVYRLQGVEINDKHIEIIVRQMLRKVKITEPGGTTFLWGDQVDRIAFEEENAKVAAEGGMQAQAVPVLLGITKASLATDSFISAASFQETTRVLTEAATLAKVDTLRGFKENVIMGHLIPAGSGFRTYNDLELVKSGDDVLKSEALLDGSEEGAADAASEKTED